MPQLSNRGGLHCCCNRSPLKPRQGMLSPHTVTELWWQNWCPNSPWLLERPFCSLLCCQKYCASLALRKQDVSSCQSSPLQRLFSLHLCERWGVRGRPLLSSMSKRATSSFILSTLVLRRVAWHHESLLREKEGRKWWKEKGLEAHAWLLISSTCRKWLFHGKCVFPHVSLLYLWWWISAWTTPPPSPFVSASSFLSLQGRKTAKRNQGRNTLSSFQLFSSFYLYNLLLFSFLLS